MEQKCCRAGPLFTKKYLTSYRQISRSLDTARSNVIMILSLWNLTSALLPMCLSNFKAFGKVWTRISRLRDLTRSCGKPVRLVNRGPDFSKMWLPAPVSLTFQCWCQWCRLSFTVTLLSLRRKRARSTSDLATLTWCLSSICRQTANRQIDRYAIQIRSLRVPGPPHGQWEV